MVFETVSMAVVILGVIVQALLLRKSKRLVKLVENTRSASANKTDGCEVAQPCSDCNGSKVLWMDLMRLYKFIYCPYCGRKLTTPETLTNTTKGN
jgi:hypothetical protein